MKKFFKKVLDLLGYAPILIPIAGALVPIVFMFIGIWKFCNGNVGMFLINIFSVPFCVLGLVNIVRGFFAIVMEQDAGKFEKYWKFVLYFIANIIGYGAIVLAIIQWVKFQ